MSTKSICSVAMALLLAGCGRQSRQSTVSPASTGPGASTTAQAATLPPRSPAPPTQATLPPTPPNESTKESPIPASARPASVTLPARTRIRVRLAESLDTRNSRPGERFTAYLDEPVVSGDRVVVPKGTAFEGRVLEARRSGRLKGRAYLGVTLYSFQLRGSTYTISTNPDTRSSASHRKRNLAIVGGGSGAGAVIGAVAGGGVGALVGAGAGAAAGATGAYVTGKKDVRLPAESTLVFSLRSAVAVRS